MKKSEAGLHEDTIQKEEDVKLCAQELFSLINSVTSYKEYVGSKIARMKSDLLETAGAVADIYKGYRPSSGVWWFGFKQLVENFPNTKVGNSLNFLAKYDEQNSLLQSLLYKFLCCFVLATCELFGVCFFFLFYYLLFFWGGDMKIS